MYYCIFDYYNRNEKLLKMSFESTLTKERIPTVSIEGDDMSVASSSSSTESGSNSGHEYDQMKQTSTCLPYKEPKKVIASATASPPAHTIALLVAIVSLFVQRLPSLESLDRDATVQTFSRVAHEDAFSLEAVIGIRLLFATLMLGNAVYVFLFGCWEAGTEYLPGSKLIEAKHVPFRGALHPEGSILSGIKCISSFTMWCWIVEGTAFLLVGVVPLYCKIYPQATVSPWLLAQLSYLGR